MAKHCSLLVTGEVEAAEVDRRRGVVVKVVVISDHGFVDAADASSPQSEADADVGTASTVDRRLLRRRLGGRSVLFVVDDDDGSFCLAPLLNSRIRSGLGFLVASSWHKKQDQGWPAGDGVTEHRLQKA